MIKIARKKYNLWRHRPFLSKNALNLEKPSIRILTGRITSKNQTNLSIGIFILYSRFT